MELAAKEGQLKATQTNAALSERMNQVRGNMSAVRAAAHTDPNSPTGAAVIGQQESAMEDQKRIQVSSIMSQSAMDANQAAYLRNASSTALLGGALGAAGSLFKGIGGLPGLSGGPGGGPGSPMPLQGGGY